jgi:CubicO group peptidase (beta-lactamase class C family)
MNDGYLPGPHPDWERQTPEQAGFDPARLAEAVRFAQEHETAWPRDIRAHIERQNQAEGEYGAIVGPMKERGPQSGVIVRGGRLVAEWGEPDRVDVTFSASKSYIGLCTGLALDRGLIRDLDDRVADSVDDGGFEGPHNGAITWRHLLQQTSEWEGTLFGKPDSIDRNRSVGGDLNFAGKGTHRDLRPPGTYWEYNDVRVNRLALALLRLFKRPLPDVLAEAVMTPIGASDTWRWHGYESSWVEVDGTLMQSVSGGAHWGGGVWITSYDHARAGLLHLHGGVWGERRLFSERWFREMRTPCAVKPVYGCLWWLNTDRAQYPNAPTSSFFALGAGQNVVWIDPEHDLVAVARWINPAAVNDWIGRVLAAVREPARTAPA